ncbi:hypothetical protein Pan44_44580 [Caulifigura coniformis]|uniref:DUF1501 domain-containing protein n=1 Tax=Caulifigura coniformis TaxID=2527983 RepID=A0A517SJV4_9PLAN|nr:DUF1501 domain-containing protein [Caulifigura coniformis]QDT56404.1 hypothetical protein Pan44_44580 [Caulifigura coniformis]
MLRSARVPAEISRRDWLRIAAATAAGVSFNSASVLKAFADQVVASPTRKRACILLWMSGGPSQIDTFDPKPGHANGGPTKAIDTSVAGVQIAENLPKLAQQMKHVAVVRSITTKEGDHSRATHFVRTGSLPQGPIRYPTLGSLFSKELGDTSSDLPNFVSIAPNRFLSPAAFGPGFLGPQYAPLFVGENGAGGAMADAAAALQVRNIELPRGVEKSRGDSRIGLLQSIDDRFLADHPGIVTESRNSAYSKAVRLMNSTGVKAFNLDDEDASLRDAYGRTAFGQGCLLARRLVERGVPFVEVSLNSAEGAGGIGWDTHADNFNAVKNLCGVLDPAWSTLLTDLEQRGLLDSTLVVWMGEFGRTPKINESTGRDHFPVAWTNVLCGGGIKGGQFVGKTSEDAMTVADRPVTVQDMFATMAMALGLDPAKTNMSNIGRPIPIAEPSAKAITEVVA